MWVEKQALAGVLSPLTDRLHVTLMVNKGYSSLSAMRESAMRFMRRTGQETEFAVNSGQKDAVLFYVGDHDPSGEDMVRDVRDRLVTFGVTNLRVEKIALTMAQIRQFKPPPNPAKVTDSRFEAYRKKYGDESWELDALDPKTLQSLIEKAVTSITNAGAMRLVLAEEKRQREKLREAMASVSTSGSGAGLQDVLDVLREVDEGNIACCHSCGRIALRERDGELACEDDATCDCEPACKGLCQSWSDLPHAGILRLTKGRS